MDADPPRAPASSAIAIRTPDQRLRVFISSTMLELMEERAAAREAVAGLRLTPILFELSARAHAPRDLYRAYLSQSDVFVGIYWEQYGQVPPGGTVSGLEEEYDLSSDLPRLIYLKEPAPNRDPKLRELLNRIRLDKVSYRRFGSPEELRELLQNDLAVLLSERFAASPSHDDGTRAGRLAGSLTARLPAPANRLIGRERELAQARELLLQSGTRLLTLTGIGGTGKTRLAIDVARSLESEFADGVAFVDLSAVEDPALVLPAIGRGLGILESSQRGIAEAAASIFAHAQLLLVLDNFERVLPAALDVLELLERVPGLKVLVTSREPLRIRPERELPIQPLPVPSQRAALGTDLEHVPAVELFAERARAVSSTFDFTGSNAEAISEIVRRLDGLPLAIEIAAVMLRAMPPATLLRRLERPLDSLRNPARDAPARHRTLREAIQSSYDLLSEAERALFRRLAVFSGGWSLAAAQAVCSLDDQDADEVFDLLLELVSKSLVVFTVDDATEPRYRLLETLREFGLDQLEAAGETLTLRRRHLEWCRSTAQAIQEKNWTLDQLEGLEEFQRELDNFRSAIDWSTQTGEGVEDALLLAGLFWLHWDIRGFVREGQQRLDRLLMLPAATAPTAARATALDASGWLNGLQTQFDIAAERYLEAARIWQDLGEMRSLSWTHARLGMLLYNDEQPDEADRYLSASVDGAKSEQDPWLEAFASFGLGHVAWARQDLEGARFLIERCLTSSRNLGSGWGIAHAEFSLSVLAFLQGDLEQAVERQREALQVRSELRDLRGMADCLGMMATLAAARGDDEHAARLLGATEVLREATGAMAMPWQRHVLDQGIARLRTALGEAEFERLRIEGRTMSAESAAASALLAR